MSSARDLNEVCSDGGSSGTNGDCAAEQNEEDTTIPDQNQQSSESPTARVAGQADDGKSESTSFHLGETNNSSVSEVSEPPARISGDGRLTLLASDSAASLLRALFPPSSADELSHQVDDESSHNTTSNAFISAEAYQQGEFCEGRSVSAQIQQVEKEILKSSSVTKREGNGLAPKPNYEHDSQQNGKGTTSIAGQEVPDALELTKAALRRDAQKARALGAITSVPGARETQQTVSTTQVKGGVGATSNGPRVSLPASFPTDDTTRVDPSGPGAFSSVPTGEATRTPLIRRSLLNRIFAAASAADQPPQQPRAGEEEESRQQPSAAERIPGAYPFGGSSELLPPVRYSGLGRSQHTANNDRDLEDLEASEGAPAGGQQMEEASEQVDPTQWASQDLMEADPVTESQVFLPEAEEVTDEDRAHRTRRKAKFVAALVAAAVLLAAVITAVILVTIQRTTNDDQLPVMLSEAPTQAPKQASALMFEDHVKSLLPFSTLRELRLRNSAQSLALEWLLQDPAREEYESWRIQQRFALATIYFAMDGDRWKGNENWLNYTHHECTWYSTHLPWDLVRHEVNSPNAKRIWDDPICGDEQYQHLKLYINALKGTIPLELFLLTSLRSVNMMGNEITGKLPSSFWKLPELQVIALMGNKITGNLPTQLGLLTQLKGLGLFSNPISGTIPTELGELDGLEELYLDTLLFSGTIPSEIGQMTKALFIDLHTNHISGRLPTEVGLLTSLETLDILGAQLTGQLPSELGLLSDLWYLDLSKNDLTGPIPEEVYEMANLWGLYLERNAFTGTLSSSIDKLWYLQNFYLQGNLLSGTIPDSISGISGLYQLHLNMNAFTGHVTSEIGQLFNLSSFYIHQNEFSGLLPSELGLLDIWPDAYLNFAYNNFEGRLPTEFRNLQDAELNVSGNPLLFGSIPSELCGLQLYFDCSDIFCGCECECPENGTSFVSQ